MVFKKKINITKQLEWWNSLHSLTEHPVASVQKLSHRLHLVLLSHTLQWWWITKYNVTGSSSYLCGGMKSLIFLPDCSICELPTLDSSLAGVRHSSLRATSFSTNGLELMPLLFDLRKAVSTYLWSQSLQWSKRKVFRVYNLLSNN